MTVEETALKFVYSYPTQISEEFRHSVYSAIIIGNLIGCINVDKNIIYINMI